MQNIVNCFRTNIHKIKKLIHSIIWFKTRDTTDWFTNVDSKHEWRFIQVDICVYYSPFNKIVLNKTLNFAKTRIGLSSEGIDIIKLARKFILEYTNSE